MKFQYLSDKTGKTTGVFIPISEWNELRSKYKNIDSEEIEIPAFQQDEVNRRLIDHKKNPELALNFDATIDKLKRES